MKFIVQESLPLEFADKFGVVLKELFAAHKTKSISNFTFNRKAVTNIAFSKGQKLKSRYLRILDSVPFSISIDEGTKTNETYLATGARFIPNNTKVETTNKLLGLIKLGYSSTGEADESSHEGCATHFSQSNY